MSRELIFVALLKVAAIVGAVITCCVLVSFIVGMSCPLDSYPSGVLAAAFASLLMLLVYSKFKFSARGIMKVRVPLVRLVFVAVVVLELAGIGVVLGRNHGCESIVRAISIPGGLLIFYTAMIFSMVFGDAYLGVLGNIIRLGVKPIDFLRDSDLK